MKISSIIRVMVVDDDAGMAKFLASHLTRRNFDVSIAATGEEAIRLFRVYDPALVLLDIAMSGLSGLETLERLKQIKPEVAVILLSALNDPEIIFKASRLGADDYMAKPLEPKELDVRINRLQHKQRVVHALNPTPEHVRQHTDVSLLIR